jgi:hypothetical protein
MDMGHSSSTGAACKSKFFFGLNVEQLLTCLSSFHAVELEYDRFVFPLQDLARPHQGHVRWVSHRCLLPRNRHRSRSPIREGVRQPLNVGRQGKGREIRCQNVCVRAG